MDWSCIFLSVLQSHIFYDRSCWTNYNQIWYWHTGHFRSNFILRDLRFWQQHFRIFISLLGWRCPLPLKYVQNSETSGNTNSATKRLITEDISLRISFHSLFIPCLFLLYINSLSALYWGLVIKFFACCFVPLPSAACVHCAVTQGGALQ
jgi:hypothetical protein